MGHLDSRLTTSNQTKKLKKTRMRIPIPDFGDANPISGLVAPLGIIADFFSSALFVLRTLFDPDTWIRAGMVILGIQFLISGVVMFSIGG
jgi:hypothetical protein